MTDRLFAVEHSWPDPAPAPVLAATEWSSNAELILDCVRLGYLRAEWRTLDPTYGQGVWWQRWEPDDLTVNRNEWDFTAAPFDDKSFDAITYDPPYVCIGGRETGSGGGADIRDRFGLADAPKTPALLQQLIDDGLTEMCRLLRPSGIVLVKCQDYISSGGIWLGTFLTTRHALSLGLLPVDRMEHITNPRPQPTLNLDGSPRRQVHARRNLSTLLVFRQPR